ncbi:hydroxyethylthiazole kinase [Pleomorphovibrio marinus]|uniref:hydroxyethylthiazole kinase n=1 Tax=Pleomorphovibrio marinus TaxID=2164132 RepID=UPI000E0AF3C8|nr:hydroxyethylthiazole kinase [Pleomorphovibrio marinus]
MESVINHLEKIRATSPLVHSITNYVAMNNTANALLAMGASPIMAHAHGEVEDMLNIVQALVINIGTLDQYWVDSMSLAAKKADDINKPWVLDPVGAGATPLRNEAITQLSKFNPTVVRGNASEIMAMAKVRIESKGVDSTHSSLEAKDAGKELSNSLQTVVCISGEKDLIIQGDKVAEVANGHALMAKVTGMGCTATAVVGACMAVEDDPFEATLSAMVLMGIAGELAAKKAKGPGTLQLYFYDALYQMDGQAIQKYAKVKR